VELLLLEEELLLLRRSPLYVLLSLPSSSSFPPRLGRDGRIRLGSY